METETVKTLRIINSLGLHARAAAKIVQVAEQYDARLFLRKGEREVDGASILSILTLACPRGTEIQARAQGPDAVGLMEALTGLFEDRFGEER